MFKKKPKYPKPVKVVFPDQVNKTPPKTISKNVLIGKNGEKIFIETIQFSEK